MREHEDPVQAGGVSIDREASDLRTLTRAPAPAEGHRPLTPARPLPTSIAGYRIVGALGSGGMGVVYEAEQQQPHRRVAVKVMRGGHEVDELHVHLFRREAETLARLKHPGIAAIYESGHTADGHDFFAMELVQGETLEAWLDARPTPVSQAELELRLRLFCNIAEAVHYAHQRGVIHRDLKPRNIFVVAAAGGRGSEPSGPRVPEIKILDFGLARLTDPDLQGATMRSQVGEIKGTLAYMSPEQARGDVDAVDLRTDVYALGMILYELLAGRRPYELSQVTVVDAVRVICEAPPEPLRTAWCGERRLDADLETIVATALAKEPERRYGSAAALADDVERYLGSQPIAARRPSRTYRTRKFVARHRVSVAAAAIVVLALVAGIVATTVGLVRVHRAEARARTEAATSGRVAEFLTELLGSVNAQEVGEALVRDLEERVAAASRSTGDDAAARAAVASFQQAMRGVSATDAGRSLVDTAILRRAGRAIGERFVDEPGVGGRLEHTLAETYDRLGMYSRAVEHASRAVAIRESALGPSDAATLRSVTLLGTLRYRLGQLDESETLLAANLQRQRTQLGADHPDTLQTALVWSWLVMERGRYDEAEVVLEATLEAQRRTLGAEHVDTITTMNSLAVLYADQGRFADAEALHSQVLALRSRLLGPSDPDTLKSMTNLAVVSFYQGRLEGAEALFADVLDIQRRELGPEHPTTLASANNLAVILERQRRFAEAEALHREVLAVKSRVLGPEHPETLSSMYNLAIACASQGRLEEADRLHRQTMELRRRLLGESSPPALDSLCAVAGVAALRGDRRTALELLAEAVDLGYSDTSALAADPDFESLREDPDFLALLERAR